MGDLERALRDDLTRWGPAIAASSLAAAALDVAHRLDNDDLAPAAASMLHGQLRKYLAELRAIAPAEVDQDDVVNLVDRIEERRRRAEAP